MRDKLLICPGYCGVSCVNGSCPIANMEEYIERGYDVVRTCDDCCYYEGCIDCAFYGTSYCVRCEKI